MKKLIVLCLTVLTLGVLLCSCSGGNKKDTKDAKNTESKSNQDNPSDSAQTDTSDLTEDDTLQVKPEELYHFANGIQVYVPTEFSTEWNDSYMMLYRGGLYYTKEFGNDTISFNFSNAIHYTDWEYDSDTSFNLEDLPETTYDDLIDAFYYIYDKDIYLNSFEKSVTSETNETINDIPFINQKGNIHINLTEGSEVDLTYTIYYTILNGKYDENQRGFISLIVFSDSNCSEETKEEFDKVALDMINNTDWNDFE